MTLLAYFLAALLICSCAALAVASAFAITVKDHKPCAPPRRWLPVDHRKDLQ